MTEHYIPEISVEKIMDEIRAEVRRRRGDSPALATAGTPSLPPLPRFARDERLPAKDAYDLHEFLGFCDDEIFLRNAYRCILKREADPGGIRYYLDLLQRGRSKVEIVGRLRFSEEGRRAGVLVHGLLAPLAVNLSYRIPLFGYALRLAHDLVSLPAIIRSIRNFESSTAARLRARDQQADEVVAAIEDRLQPLSPLIRRSADCDLLEDLYGQLAQKLDAAALDEVQAQLAGKSDEEAVRALLGRLAEKADAATLDRLRDQLEQKADAAALAHMQDHLSRFDKVVLRELQKTAARKAELSDLEEIGRRVAQKADLQALRRLDQELRTLGERLDDKAARESLEAVRGELAGKADLELLRLLAAELKTAEDCLNEKAASALVEKLRQDLKQMDLEVKGVGRKVEEKAGRETLEALREEVAGKADLEIFRCLDVEMQSLAGRLEGKAARETVERIREDLAEAGRQVKRNTVYITDLQKRLDIVQQAVRELLPAPSPVFDRFYLDFEDRFRGSREKTKEKLVFYLPYVEKALAATGGGSVLDLGSGRGDWLELLRDHGIPSRGVDINLAMIQECAERGLDAVEMNALDYLKSLPDASVGAITGFHVIEHLPFHFLIELVDEAVRVLRNGGVMIFETPNPENVIVGSCNFYLDPTHLRPLPPDLTKFVFESKGLSNVDVVHLNPVDPTDKDALSVPRWKKTDSVDVSARFNYFFYGPMDYGVISWKGEQ